MTPTEIAEALDQSRPDLRIAYDNTGGNIACIIAQRADSNGSESAVFIGTAAGHLGYSDDSGDQMGEWEDIDVYDAWQQNDDIDQKTANLIIARAAVAIYNLLPTRPPAPTFGLDYYGWTP